MPPDEFWHGKPSRFLSYVEAYRLRLEREEKMKAGTSDYQAWLIGAYVHTAVGVILSNSFGKGKKQKYLAEPISYTQRKNKTKKAKEDEERQLKEQFLAFKHLTDVMNGGLKRR